MTKTDFVAIQNAIRDARMALWYSGGEQDPLVQTVRVAVNQAFDSMARDIASVLAKQNPKFKRTEFLKGCGVQ